MSYALGRDSETVKVASVVPESPSVTVSAASLTDSLASPSVIGATPRLFTRLVSPRLFSRSALTRR